MLTYRERAEIQERTELKELRDHFAGQALAGMLADHTRDAYPHEYAENAYKYADAMLAERAKK